MSITEDMSITEIIKKFGTCHLYAMSFRYLAFQCFANHIVQILHSYI